MTTLRKRYGLSTDEELEGHRSDTLKERLANRGRKLFLGTSVALKGAYSASSNPAIRRMWKEWIAAAGHWLLIGYASLGILFTLCAPILPILALWGSLWGLFGQALIIVTLLISNLVLQSDRMISGRLFLNELEFVDPQTAKELAKMFKRDANGSDLYRSLRISFHFTKFTLLLSMISFIPLIGSPIAVLGQLWLSAERLGWQLLNIYCVNCKGMNYKQQKRWMRARKWTIIGFMLPFSFATSIPFIGIFFLALAQAAVAHLHTFDFFTTVIPPPQQRETKKSFRSQKIWRETEHTSTEEPTPGKST